MICCLECGFLAPSENQKCKCQLVGLGTLGFWLNLASYQLFKGKSRFHFFFLQLFRSCCSKQALIQPNQSNQVKSSIVSCSIPGSSLFQSIPVYSMVVLSTNFVLIFKNFLGVFSFSQHNQIKYIQDQYSIVQSNLVYFSLFQTYLVY